mgnify:CR=1 FL=1
MYSPNFSGLSNYSRGVCGFGIPAGICKHIIICRWNYNIKTSVWFAAGTCTCKDNKDKQCVSDCFLYSCVLSALVMGVLFTSILAKSGLLNNIFEVIGLSAFAKEWLGTYSTAMGAVIMIEGWMWSGFNAFIFIAGIQPFRRIIMKVPVLKGHLIG